MYSLVPFSMIFRCPKWFTTRMRSVYEQRSGEAERQINLPYNMEIRRMTDPSSAANCDFSVRRLAPTHHRHVTRTQNNRAYAESRLFRIFLLFHLSFEKRRSQNHPQLHEDENVNQKAVIISTRNNPYWIYMLQSNIKWI